MSRRVLRQRPELLERAAWDGAGMVTSATLPRLVHHGSVLRILREAMHGPGQFRPLGQAPERKWVNSSEQLFKEPWPE